MVKVVTYNCRGLRNKNKLRRILDKSNKLVAKGAVVALQETHKIEETYMNNYWTHKYVMNCNLTDQRGVMILFNNKYELVNHYKDEEDRIIIANIKSETLNLIVANVYSPNDHRDSILVTENLYHNLLKYKYDSPDGHVFLAGDLNCCMSERDSLNRQSTKNERILAENFSENNDMMKLKDGYRHLNKEEGFTWNRGSCFSRLDYIFVSENILSFLEDWKIDWAYDQSDHAALILGFNFPIANQFGPGIARVNTSVLQNPMILSQIRKNLLEYMEQVPSSWNPNVKLEFLKVGIRTVFSEAAKQNKISKRYEQEMSEGELNQLFDLKIKVTNSSNLSISEKTSRLETIELAISQVRLKLTIEETKYSEELANKARIKWYELGEKSNKYFLGLLKLRQKQKYIGEIICEGIKYVGQQLVMVGIKDFYANLYGNIERPEKDEDDFYAHCPKLTEDQKTLMDMPLTLDEIGKALKSCKESSPGPDGISYSIYKSLWDISAPIILDSWTYSVKTGLLPQSQIESVITLLPKEGKDIKDIKNWRPITLANCDSKIVTKALANRMARVLETIIDKSQTAYIPGRSVMDNIRSNFLTRSHCKSRNLKALLISLDAKKAFDSVSHKYICRTLKEYGFGENFITYFKTLYNNLSANVMINGHKSVKIDIRRGVKQGDALSCALFIICIDPLLRNVNHNKRIKGIEVNNSLGKFELKINGYADDIAIITSTSKDSISQVFKEYERLSIRSGLELNADKTEIINLNCATDKISSITIDYLGKEYKLDVINKLKICGVYYANDLEEEYKLNVMDKIVKLKNQLKKWMVRNLTLEGKVLIVKTFGLSQLIYNMQCYGIEKKELIFTEKLIFKFLWSKTWDDDKRCTERIKRSILKNDFIHGGIKAPDVESLDKALKLKQFLRCSTTSHPVLYLQIAALERLKCDSRKQQEYSRLCSDDAIIHVGQQTTNILTDYCRKNNYGGLEKAKTLKIATDLASSINIKEYLERKNMKLLSCLYNSLRNESIITLGELLQEREVIGQHNQLIENILKSFSSTTIEIASQYDENVNDYNSNNVWFLDEQHELKEAGSLQVRDLQKMIKLALNKVEILNINTKNNLTNFEFDVNHITRFRKQCRNTKLRSIFHRLINKDFFHAVKLDRFKITNSTACQRCQKTEDNLHLLYQCKSSLEMWACYNKVIKSNNSLAKMVKNYEDIFDFSGGSLENILKVKLIQETIQIKRPMNWSEDRVRNIYNEQEILFQANKMPRGK
jgi:exonuclease III